jgi:hypothetical protein
MPANVPLEPQTTGPTKGTSTVQGWKSEKDPPAFCQRGRQPEEVADNVKIVSGD